MKKIALLLSVIASALVLASCASKGTMDQSNVSSTPAPVHHDYKGETSTK